MLLDKIDALELKVEKLTAMNKVLVGKPKRDEG